MSQVEDALRNEVAHSTFDNAPCGGGAEVYQPIRVEQRLQVRHHRSVQILKILTAVSDHRRAKRLERLVTDFDRSRDMKLQVRHKAQRAYFEAPSQIKRRVSFSKKLAAPPILTHNARPLGGEVAEWLKAHAWKA